MKYANFNISTNYLMFNEKTDTGNNMSACLDIVYTSINKEISFCGTNMRKLSSAIDWVIMRRRNMQQH